MMPVRSWSGRSHGTHTARTYACAHACMQGQAHLALRPGDVHSTQGVDLPFKAHALHACMVRGEGGAMSHALGACVRACVGLDLLALQGWRRARTAFRRV